ncbi:MAG: hypothetical protein K9N49_09520 [Candidatus Marinimicrobia bacterium]|nr:hypothetical protein [Candidatus Neomarinimicrobiota bacterium]
MFWEIKMKADPILRELWEIKDGLAAECQHDLRRLFEKLKASQENRGVKTVNRTNLTVAEPEGPGYDSQARRTCPSSLPASVASAPKREIEGRQA